MQWLSGLSAESLEIASAHLRSSDLVAVPTETVYGLAANALDETAVRKIFSVKGRPLLDPLIVHFGSPKEVQSHCEWNSSAEKLAERFWPGPLTMVLRKKSDCQIPSIVSAGKPTLAVRVPGHPLFQSLLRASSLPIAAPSANPFGYISPTRPEHVADSLPDGVEAVLDGGPCEHGVESTIIEALENNEVRLLRPGPISLDQILTLTGLTQATPRETETSAPAAPGMLTSHYRPLKGIVLFEAATRPEADPSTDAVVFLKRPTAPGPNDFWLSETGEAREVAQELFGLMRKLDSDSRFTRIQIEMPYKDEGIWTAVRDRLRRAAAEPE